MGDEESLSGATATNTPSGPQTNGTQAAASTTSDEYTLGGYHEIASMMARWPVTAIFKRFGFLSYLNILYLQAELEMLEKALLEKAQEDKTSPDKWRRQYFFAFNYMYEGLTESAETDLRQWQIVRRIRTLLKEYSMSEAHVVTAIKLLTEAKMKLSCPAAR